MPKSRTRKLKRGAQLSKQQRKLVAKQQERNLIDTNWWNERMDELDALEAEAIARQNKEDS
jgi:hypothetical protein